MELKNKGAKENGWEDVGAYWRSWYEVDDLEITVEGFRTDLKPESAEFPKFAANKESPPTLSSCQIPPIDSRSRGNAIRYSVTRNFVVHSVL